MTLVDWFGRIWHRLQRRLRYDARHSEGYLPPAAKYVVAALVFAATVVLIAYALTVR
ncbi:hypothetical protein ORI20_21520 [Mycobacterium sp. CVI_P3]|uniref:hypothetical protein n=1 Tax=Mycobacterium pinniadriaticum TaxID=2994102 RepID=UPI002248AE26|nr:hypothetical protein [Mycobacterium pinniadriaticum]MCX2932857.1 hypothetical protein [Mycobacterium pinniadriaticum]